MHPNYRKGVRKERKVVNQLKAEGWDIAQRSAGSHSPVDIWAVNLKTKEIMLIQCKPDNYKDTKKYQDLIDIDGQMFKIGFKII
jgi:Holliday junction resolvase